jgi:ribonuclease T1
MSGGGVLRLLLLSVFIAASAAAGVVHADPRIDTVHVTDLPDEVRQTLSLIRRGGPFPHRKDGTVFGNFERRLPPRPHGYYREYTVPTPGARDRGARRIVAGKGTTGDTRTSGEYYYSDDHYRSFRKLLE